MERLAQWLQSKYDLLRSEFGQKTFTQDDVMQKLAEKQTNVADLLSGLEHAGYLIKETDAIDQRMRSYRLVDIVHARQLNDNLEAWRQAAADQSPPLAEAIDRSWARIRAILGQKMDVSATPEKPGQLTVAYVGGTVKPAQLQIVKVTDLSQLAKDDQDAAKEVLKLFDASGNYFRSVTNALLEYEKLRRDLAAGEYDLPVGDYVSLDGLLLKPAKEIPNKSLCPICRRFKQSHTALALITGNPKMDSAFQMYRTGQTKRASMNVCAYCFTAGWVDLPAALIAKAGQSINKGREYLFITTPLARDDVQLLIDSIARRDTATTVTQSNGDDEETTETESEQPTEVMVDTVVEEPEEVTGEDREELSVAGFAEFILKKYGVEGGDQMAVLGLSAKRLHELKGFVLPSANPLLRVVAVRVPVERLVGEPKVSGGVRRELVKATMYDFWQITGGSLHHNRITDAPFSVDGQPIELEEMRRANLAYYIASRYARTGKRRQLNSGLFMLLLSQPREAANRILRAKHREKRYAPGTDKVKEVIELAESVAQQDWRFDLGLRIVKTLSEVGLLKKAEGFRFGPGPEDVFSSVDLVKWLQRTKMIRDEASARAWGNMLINALKRGDLAYKEYIRSRGGQITAPGKETVRKILDLVDGEDGIIQTCAKHGYKLSELSRDIANMDYYLLFYYNQRQAAQNTNQEATK